MEQNEIEKYNEQEITLITPHCHITGKLELCNGYFAVKDSKVLAVFFDRNIREIKEKTITLSNVFLFSGTSQKERVKY